MGQAALQQVFEGAILMPPAFSMDEVLKLAEGVNELEAKITQGERAALAWRDGTDAELDALRTKIAGAIGDMDLVAVYKALQELVSPLLDDLKSTIAEMQGQSVLKLFQPALKKVRSNQRAAAYLNQQAMRADRVRHIYIDAYVSYFYELAALLASYDPDATAEGDPIETPQQLEDFLARLAS